MVPSTVGDFGLLAIDNEGAGACIPGPQGSEGTLRVERNRGTRLSDVISGYTRTNEVGAPFRIDLKDGKHSYSRCCLIPPRGRSGSCPEPSDGEDRLAKELTQIVHRQIRRPVHPTSCTWTSPCIPRPNMKF